MHTMYNMFRYFTFSLLCLVSCTDEEEAVEYSTKCTTLSLIGSDSFFENYSTKNFLREVEVRQKYILLNDKKEFIVDIDLVSSDSFLLRTWTTFPDLDTLSFHGRFLHIKDSFYFHTKELPRGGKYIVYKYCKCLIKR